jgi:hypothetical protein
VLFFINEKIQSKTNQGLPGLLFSCAEMRLIGERNSRSSSSKIRKKRAKSYKKSIMFLQK